MLHGVDLIDGGDTAQRIDVDATLLECRDVVVHTRQEVLIVTILLGCPCDFRECQDTGEEHVFGMGLIEDILRPEVGLYTEDVLGLGRCQLLRYGVVRIDLLQRDEATISAGLVIGLTLIEVQIDVAIGGEDDIVAFLGSLDSTLFATPAHDRSVGSETTHEDLIPADELAALAVEVLLDTADHIALERVVVLETFALHACLTLGALTPVLHRSFVTTDVDVLRGEDRHDFVEDIFEELEGLLIPDTYIGVLEGPFVETAQLGISSEDLVAMSREFDLGDDRDAEAGSVVEYGMDVLQAVVAAVAPRGAFVDKAAILLPPLVPVTYCAEGGLLRQEGVLLRGEAPAPTVDEVPVEAVELIASHLIQETDDHIAVHEVTRDVEHHSAIGQAC